jgi:hypothetical protein
VQRGGSEVTISSQNLEIVSSAQLDNQSVDCANLNTVPAASASDFCCVDIVLSIRLNKGQGGETLYDAVTCFRASKSLQQLMQDQASAENLISS